MEDEATNAATWLKNTTRHNKRKADEISVYMIY